MPIGTRVRLASGGTVMLVTGTDPLNGRVLCEWQNDDGSIGAAWLPIVVLDVVRRHHVIDG